MSLKRRLGVPPSQQPLVLGVLLLIFFSRFHIAQGRPIPTNIPRNKLSLADATYLLMRDNNKNWLKAEAESANFGRSLLALSPDELRYASVAPVIIHGDERLKEVAFTFDDGPHAAYTPDLIQILLKYHVPATMFLVGTQCERYPYLVRDEEKDGFTVGNHTYHHFALTKIPPQYIGSEIEGCGDVIHGIIGKTPTLFRPPGGDYTPSIAHVAGELGYTTVLWTVDPGDFDKPSASVILARTLAKASNGAIFLFHDGIPETMEALPLIIDYLRISGYTIVSLNQMLSERAKSEDFANHLLLLAKTPRASTASRQPPLPISAFNAIE